MPVSWKPRQNRKSATPSSARSKRRGPNGDGDDPNDDFGAAPAATSKRRCTQRRKATTRPKPGPLQSAADAAAKELVKRREVIGKGIMPVEDKDQFKIEVLSWDRSGPVTIVRGRCVQGANFTSEVEIVFDSSVNRINLFKGKHLKICTPWQEFNLPAAKTFICSVITEEAKN